VRRGWSASHAYAGAPVVQLGAYEGPLDLLLELPERARVYRPNPPPLWRVPDALARMHRLLLDMPDGAPLSLFLPPTAGEGPAVALLRRAALASTLLAGLELSREGAVVLEQKEAFAEIRVAAASPGAMGAAA
jgi:segregation and condensation protein A